MVIVIAQRNAQHLLGLVLFDDEAIEVFLHLAGFVAELELVCFRRMFGAFRSAGSFGFRRRLHARALKMLPHEFRHLTLELFRRRWSTRNWSGHKTQ